MNHILNPTSNHPTPAGAIGGKTLLRQLPQMFHGLFVLMCIAIGLLAAVGCEQKENVELDPGKAQVIVDAFISNEVDTQQIYISITRPYFDAGVSDVQGARVWVGNSRNLRIFEFTEARDTMIDDKDRATERIVYRWVPVGKDSLGAIGDTIGLRVEYNGQTYQSLARINRTAILDSVIVKKDDEGVFQSDELEAEFFGRDQEGTDDTYWIRTWYNGKRLINSRFNLVNIAYDGGFNAGANTDGLDFIRPIRQNVGPDEGLETGDTLAVEIHSISPETFTFFSIARLQIQNGGLFATPPANVPTNIFNENASSPERPVGWFNVAAVVRRGVRVK
jgi:hypothetical protein